MNFEMNYLKHQLIQSRVQSFFVKSSHETVKTSHETVKSNLFSRKSGITNSCEVPHNEDPYVEQNSKSGVFRGLDVAIIVHHTMQPSWWCVIISQTHHHIAPLLIISHNI